MAQIDDDFIALPRAELADAAMDAARRAGAEWVDVRVERIRDAGVSLKDGALSSSADATDSGIGVRVIVDGAFGFAATGDLRPEAAVSAARRAVELAKVSRPLATERVELAGEPTHADQTWISRYEVDPFEVGAAAWTARLADFADRLAGGVTHSTVSFRAVKEHKYYADHAGTSTTQQRIRIQPEIAVVLVGDDGVETMSSTAPPVARGWEYLTAGPDAGGWDYDTELARLPEWVAEKMAAPSVEPGPTDVLIDPTNLWLTIHESIGHATELDRALGYEAAYAGTSFATLDQLGTLHYGSPAMRVTGDRTDPYGLASIGFDDEGVAAQQFDLIRDGTLVGFQLDRRMARQNGLGDPAGRSNGCAYADSPGHVTMQRMPNVSLQPLPDGPDLNGLLAALGDGLYIVGDRSWSIDMQRYNFQFTGQRFFRVRGGRITGQVKDVAYQATTTDFWRSMSDIGGPSTYLLGGAFNCGKAQPGQVAAVSHGCPAAVFRGVNILNTLQEAGQ
ncbi:MAG: TldD/PmbA family protein [Actinomycetales bacterium]